MFFERIKLLHKVMFLISYIALLIVLGYIISGEFVVVNKHLLHDLTDMGLWSPTLKNKIIYENGSIVNVPEIPDDLKAIYRYRTWFFLCSACSVFILFYLCAFLKNYSGLCGRLNREQWLTWPLIVGAL